ncbi:CBS domain-containing protein [Streptomyces sp. NBC_00024]|uniref:CBS domain-containing protein n=1 Tax=Streptomyces sp. NBC_00024 TaxID=2903612 RepID=UPI003244A119
MLSSTPPTAADAMLAPEVQVSDHTSIDRALDVLRGSHTEFVLIRDDTGRCAGLVTRDQLAVPGAKPWYAENTRVRDIAHDHSPFARPGMPAADVAADLRERSLTALPVVDDDGYALGIVTATRLQMVLAASAGGTDEQP